MNPGVIFDAPDLPPRQRTPWSTAAKACRSRSMPIRCRRAATRPPRAGQRLPIRPSPAACPPATAMRPQDQDHQLPLTPARHLRAMMPPMRPWRPQSLRQRPSRRSRSLRPSPQSWRPGAVRSLDARRRGVKPRAVCWSRFRRRSPRTRPRPAIATCREVPCDQQPQSEHPARGSRREKGSTTGSASAPSRQRMAEAVWRYPGRRRHLPHRQALRCSRRP